MVTAIRMDMADNVAMVTAQVEAGQEILIMETSQIIKALESIGPGHKVALKRLDKGGDVVKYGIPIGRLTADVEAGAWISTHNLEDTTEELCGTYCQAFREGPDKPGKAEPAEGELAPPADWPSDTPPPRTIRAYPRRDGSFGIRNYIMIIPANPSCNAAAESISDQTGCAWYVCDRTRLENGALTDYSKKAMMFTGRNPNVYAVLVIDAQDGGPAGKEIYRSIVDSGKQALYMTIRDNKEQQVILNGITVIRKFQKEAAALARVPVPMEGFGLTVHCSGSDWTTAINGNSAVGVAADLIVKNGGRIFMTEWMEWCGSQHILAEQCATHELGLQLLDAVDEVRAVVLRETGNPVEYMNPVQANKDAGLTTLVEKSTGTIKKAGSTPIQGILDYCEAPTGRGVWLPKHDSVWPPTSAIYGALSGAHMNILVTGLGFLYYELPHMLSVRVSGNPATYQNGDFKIDFNAGMAFDDMSIADVGEMLFAYLVRVAEGEEEPKTEADKERAFNMYYYTENEFGPASDSSKKLYCSVKDYQEKRKAYTDSVK
ncbi:MAG: altronate dehydratase family protein [Clostridiales bacterium]|nr:altronate dehydratase family protein [Clostridiales bacterium]